MMEIKEFERLLHIGLGRAILFAQENDLTPYRDLILHTCLHNTAYDPQCEGSRAAYMFDIIRLTGEEQFYRQQILTALARSDSSGDWDEHQLFDFAGLFARNGDAAAANSGIAAYIQRITENNVRRAKAARERKNAPSLNYDEIKSLIVEKRDKVPRGRLFRWGKSAGDEELARAAADLLVEDDRLRLVSYLRLFQKRRFPLEMNIYVPLLHSSFIHDHHCGGAPLVGARVVSIGNNALQRGHPLRVPLRGAARCDSQRMPARNDAIPSDHSAATIWFLNTPIWSISASITSPARM